MGKLLLVAALVVLGWKLVTGRWPWEPKRTRRALAVIRARKLLGVSEGASREEILSAHKRVLATVHPDRGGSSAAVHEANAARDMLLAELSYDPQEKA